MTEIPSNIKEVISHLKNGWVLIQTIDEHIRWKLVSSDHSSVKDISHLTKVLENLEDDNTKRLFDCCNSDYGGKHRIRYTPDIKKIKTMDRDNKLNDLLD
jgi:hypothetical protein